MSKVTSKKFAPLIGFHKNLKRIVPIKYAICFRKPMGLHGTRKLISRYRYAIGMVSAHNIYRKPNTPFCSLWCHCFKDPVKYLGNKPSILLSESDFVDPKFITVYPRPKKFKWDFYYFTVGGELGSIYKGFDIFIKSLPTLVDKYKLRGVIIKYANRRERFFPRIPSIYKKQIKVVSKKLNPRQISQLMSQSRFGFFPNTQDCSPLLITESIVRNCPVLINEDILGGWKYGKDGMGLLFNLSNLDEKINMIMNDSFSPKSNYMKYYGYKNTSIRLANFCRKYLPRPFKRMMMVGFAGTERMMRMYGH